MTRREMNRVSSLGMGCAALLVVSGRAPSGRALAAQAPRIQHTLLGTVVAVDAVARVLTVQARRLEAWMGAITSTYGVDNRKLLLEVRAGDQIMGKLFEGETILRHVEIVAVTARRAAAG